jgi:hypothetical protein
MQRIHLEIGRGMQNLDDRYSVDRKKGDSAGICRFLDVRGRCGDEVVACGAGEYRNGTLEVVLPAVEVMAAFRKAWFGVIDEAAFSRLA